MNHCEFMVVERKCMLAIRLMSTVILMSGYFKVIIFIRSCKKKKEKKTISMHNRALVTWHLKTHSQKDVSNYCLTREKEANYCLGDL